MLGITVKERLFFSTEMKTARLLGAPFPIDMAPAMPSFKHLI
jgi:hypothetical protein